MVEKLCESAARLVCVARAVRATPRLMRSAVLRAVAGVGVGPPPRGTLGGWRLEKKAQDPAGAGVAGGSAPAMSGEAAEAPPLRDAAAKRGRKIGVALATWFFDHPWYGELA